MSDGKGLTKDIVELFLADEESVDLSKITAIDDEAVESLSKHKGLLDLCSLTSLSDAAAEILSKHEGFLYITLVRGPDPPRRWAWGVIQYAIFHLNRWPVRG